MMYALFVSYSIEAYMELKVIQKQHTYLVYIAKSKLGSMEGNSILLDQEGHVCGIYSG